MCMLLLVFWGEDLVYRVCCSSYMVYAACREKVLFLGFCTEHVFLGAWYHMYVVSLGSTLNLCAPLFDDHLNFRH